VVDQPLFNALRYLVRLIQFTVFIETVVTVSTIQVEDDVKRELFAVAAELQSKLGRRVSLSEAIKVLLESYKAKERDVARMLSLFGCLGQASDAQRLLDELRVREGNGLE